MNVSARPTCAMLLKNLPDLFIQCIGNADFAIESVRGPDQAVEGCVVFCSQAKALSQALQGSASALVVSRKAAADTEAKRGSKIILVATNVERALAATVNRWFLGTPYRDTTFSGVHSTAVIHQSVDVPSSARIGPHAVVGANVKLSANVYIGANTVIEDGCEIGEGTVIHPLVYVGHHTLIGARCEIHAHSVVGKEGFGYAHDEKGNHYRIPHQGHVVLEDDVHIGANCNIDRATFGETRICTGTKMDNQVQIAHNCRVGRNGLLTCRFGMAGSSSVGDNFLTGGNTVLTGHIEVTDNVQIGGNSGVTKSITEPGQYAGFPLMPLQDNIKMRAALVHLPEIRKHVAMLMKKIFPDNGAGTGREADT